MDCTIQATEQPRTGQPRILGYDAVDTIVELGQSVEDEPLLEHFVMGDRILYAGSIDRSGSDAEYQLLEAHLAAHAPTSLSDAKAAALPLAELTAWELLFDRLEETRPEAASAVIIGGGGGRVGSMVIQLLHALTNVTVIATASRPVKRAWCEDLGATTFSTISGRSPRRAVLDVPIIPSSTCMLQAKCVSLYPEDVFM